MKEMFLHLSLNDQFNIIKSASAQSQRRTNLFEKDIWVVWVLDVLFQSHLAKNLTFKGGTSLSKAYKVIDRFSEDVDLTYDIRQLLPDWTTDNHVIPDNRSQVRRWTKEVNHRLPLWIANEVIPLINNALAVQGLTADTELDTENPDTLLLHYPTLHSKNSYVMPSVKLEFGGRTTGEPHQTMPVVCDVARYVDDIVFPTASPQVMSISRTFWEKVTAMHVYCLQSKIRGERYARHWFDIVKITESPYIDDILNDKETAELVTIHKNHFFAVKDINNQAIDYHSAITGKLQLVPTKSAREALAQDYALMAESSLLINDQMTFEDIAETCTALQAKINGRYTSDLSGAGVD